MNEQIYPAKSRRGRPPRRELYRRLHAEAAELRERLGGLPRPEEAVDIWRGIWYEEAHHSTAIEGNTLLLRQVERLLADGVAVGNRELREYLEVRGYGSAAEWVYRQALDPAGLCQPGQILSLAEVRQIHHTAMAPVWEVTPHPDATDRETPGSFREHDIKPFPGGMIPVEWPLVSARMENWIADANAINPGRGRFPGGRLRNSTAASSRSTRPSMGTGVRADSS